MEIKIIKSLEVVPIGSVFLYPDNPREIEKSQFEKLKKSITTNGFIDPLVVNRRSHADYKPEERKPTVVGGNMRWRAANELGLKEVPVVWIDVGRNEEKIINIALNRISGKWDIDKLEKMVYEISNKDLKLDLDLTGLEDWEQKLYNPGEDINPDISDLNLPEKAIVYSISLIFKEEEKDLYLELLGKYKGSTAFVRTQTLLGYLKDKK
jgi:hypothetical protein